MGSQSVTCYPTQVNAHRLTLARRLVLGLPTLEGWKAELTYRLPVNHGAVQRPGVELATSRSQVRNLNHYITEPSVISSALSIETVS